ncbi:hypothetical protein IGL98_001973 [Enterococcus sp. DIV0840]|uniref:hypothetical protein n=1 Tax=Enterococcus TaxID=1350 RepID=UPI001A90ADD4|nr:MULTISPECIES: hypothetical protein [Enterococcus]MBO0432943.1 hypothetical protein [Enterococcus sp. DIV0849a]MBO0475020.1 hypothetical protein [Enterococcus ureasiticus]
MKTIIFTKKHIVMFVVFFFLFLLMIVLGWFMGFSPKQEEVGKIKQEIVKTEKEAAALHQSRKSLEGKKNLLDSTIVNELPRFSKGIQIQEYLTGLEQKVEKNRIKLKQITAEDTLLFSSPNDQTKKVYSSKIVLEFSTAGKQEFVDFIHNLENDQRFIKVTDFSYKSSSEEGNATTFDFTLLFNMYYLNVKEESKE